MRSCGVHFAVGMVHGKQQQQRQCRCAVPSSFLRYRTFKWGTSICVNEGCCCAHEGAGGVFRDVGAVLWYRRSNVSCQPSMSSQLETTTTTGLNPVQLTTYASPKRAESPAQNEEVSSSSDDSDSDDDYEDSDKVSYDEDDAEPALGPLQRLSSALRTQQQLMLAKRRHPVLEWKAVAQWHTDNAAGLVAAEQQQKHREEIAAEKAARRERKVKRKAQREFTKRKEIEFRTLLEEYSLAIVNSEKRTALLTQFSIENRSIEKKKFAAIEAVKRAEQLREAAEKIAQAEKRDEEEKQATLDNLQQCIDASNEMGRRCGILPAINTPPTSPIQEQDETSTVLIIRVNNAPPTNDVESRSPFDQTVRPMTAKRQYFTLNLKRCKHAEELRGERIGDRGAKELARSLLTGACPRVRSIRLGWNLVKYSGVAALADSFTRGACAQLQELDLRCNNIDSKAFATLLTALEKGALPELLEIGLQGNLLGDEGARALAHAFFRGTLHTLRRIDVRQNRIRNDGVLALWNVFTAPNFRRFCPTLELLNMRRNDAHGALTRSFCPCPPYLEF